MSHNQITALITLMEDPDPEIFTHVRRELCNYGEAVIPHLEHHWELNSYGELFQERVERLIHTIHFDGIAQRLAAWISTDESDLFEGAMLINRYQYPTLDTLEVHREISKIRQDIWLELNDNLTALEKVKVFNHILYDVHGFTGNKQNYSSPTNSFLSDVLQSRKGNPLTLAVLYRILAQSLDVPIYGVNLPNHFILAYVDESAMMALDQDVPSNNGILFYINPFSRGEIIHKTEIDEFLDYLDLPKRASFYAPCENGSMVQRMLNNLVYSYSQLGKDDKVDELRQLYAMFQLPEVDASSTDDASQRPGNDA